MKIRCWGTRGSLAKPGANTVRYGGNTACVEVRADDGTVVILDCGTGAHELGLVLAREAPFHGTMLITHTHWDHIQGFPFFSPLFIPGYEWDVMAPHGFGQSLDRVLAGQMEYAYFPVTIEQLGAQIAFHGLAEGEFTIGSIRVIVRFLNHPTPTMGYRLEVGGVSVVYATDHEPYSRHKHEITNLPVHHEDLRHIEFLAGADLVIHDAQYTTEEYAKKVGWGHSSYDQVVDFALAARVKRLLFFHHDPLRADEELTRIVQSFQQQPRVRDHQLRVEAAAEGLTIDLPEGGDASLTTGESALLDHESPAVQAQEDDTAAIRILVTDDDPDVRSLIVAAIRAEGYQIITAADGEQGLKAARTEQPDLIILDWDMPKHSGVEVCRLLREDANPYLHDVPVVLVTAFHVSAEDMTAAFEAGVTDYLNKPFTPQQLRSRVHAWLRRIRHSAAESETS